MSQHAVEVAAGRRFEFGKNWRQFLKALTPERLAAAEESLCSMLRVADLRGKKFLDAGCGSGLFSLAARRLGARVHAFDFDPQSVACAGELKARFDGGGPDHSGSDADWTIEEGSVLDRGYLASLGSFDVVYSWGVLHHTGAMWTALDNITIPVAPGGQLFISIYNHQVPWTAVHTRIKRTYVASPTPVRWLLAAALIAFQMTRGLVKDLLLLRNPLARYRPQARQRGMSWWHDCLDWIGGYPFETATPEAIFDYFAERGFSLERMTTCGAGSGCNQFVFRKVSAA